MDFVKSYSVQFETLKANINERIEFLKRQLDELYKELLNELDGYKSSIFE